jgi:hypothetical protein
MNEYIELRNGHRYALKTAKKETNERAGIRTLDVERLQSAPCSPGTLPDHFVTLSRLGRVTNLRGYTPTETVIRAMRWPEFPARVCDHPGVLCKSSYG